MSSSLRLSRCRSISLHTYNATAAQWLPVIAASATENSFSFPGPIIYPSSLRRYSDAFGAEDVVIMSACRRGMGTQEIDSAWNRQIPRCWDALCLRFLRSATG